MPYFENLTMYRKTQECFSGSHISKPFHKQKRKSGVLSRSWIQNCKKFFYPKRLKQCRSDLHLALRARHRLSFVNYMTKNNRDISRGPCASESLTNTTMYLCIYNTTPFRTEMCTFLFWIVYCGIWDRCIVGFGGFIYNEYTFGCCLILYSCSSVWLWWRLDVYFDFCRHDKCTTKSALKNPGQSDVENWLRYHNDVIMTKIASQITSLTVVYSTVYTDADQRKHQSSASLAFVWGIPCTKGQLRRKCFHLMTSSWIFRGYLFMIPVETVWWHGWLHNTNCSVWSRIYAMVIKFISIIYCDVTVQ